MKTYSLLLFCALFFTGCATSSISTAKVGKPEKHYVGILTLVASVDTDFTQLDSVTYEKYIRREFNNLEQSHYREQLEKTLKRNLSEAQTRVIGSSEVFKLNTDVSYSEFMKKVNKTGVDGILFVNLRNYWYGVEVSDHYNFVKTAEEEPNALFHTYLLDSQSLQPVWYARSIIRGVFAGYDTLNNHLARQLTAKLQKDDYVLRPQL